MPGLSGAELVQALQAICPEATFVIVAEALEAVEGLGRMSHVHAVISKPWTEEGLVAMIEGGVSGAQQRAAWRSGSSDTFVAIGGQFVLLVEDSDSDVRLLETFVERVAPGEFRLVRARTLAEAKRFLQRRPYSVVLADLGLPDAQGLNALTTLLGVSPTTPVLVVTGADDEALARKPYARALKTISSRGTTTRRPSGARSATPSSANASRCAWLISLTTMR